MSYPDGLTSAQAFENIRKFGNNQFEDRKNSFFTILKRNFINSLTIMLVIVAIVTFFLDDPVTAAIIFALIIVNGLLGTYQEYRSEKTAQKLKEQITYTVKIKRDGAWKNLSLNDVAVGDVVRVEHGDKIPADLRIYDSENLIIDESVLTGESFPASKTSYSEDKKKSTSSTKEDKSSKAYMGTVVAGGYGIGEVTEVGLKTEFGKTAKLLNVENEASSFEKSLEETSNSLVKIVLVSVLIIFIANVLLGKELVDSGLFAVALAVGLVPQALPVIITITLSRGALVLGKKGVIVKRLSSIEDLGNVNILCTDKTGTLTENHIEVKSSINEKGQENSKALEYAIMSVYRTAGGNPIDDALLLLPQNDTDLKKRLEKTSILDTLEFDFERKRMSALVKTDKEHLIITKGAPEAVLSACKIAATSKANLISLNKKLGDEGFRAIAIAIKKTTVADLKTTKGQSDKSFEKDLTFVGFVTFLDPPKTSVSEVLGLARSLGVSIKILTGDSAAIAKHIANSVGFKIKDSQILTGPELDNLLKKQTLSATNQEILEMDEKEIHELLQSSQLDTTIKDEVLRHKLETSIIFARLSPSQKHFVVKKLKEYGHAVAFMGDGVNDAPAIKEADVGISVNNGTDITKEAADIILLQKDLKAVIAGISGGRKIFSNIIKYVRTTLAGNFGNIFTVGISSLFINFIPLTPLQILYANFLTDSPMVSISSDNVDDEELVRPKRWDVSEVMKHASIFGFISTIFDFMLIFLFLSRPEEIFRSALFIEIILTEIVSIISLRSRRVFYLAEPLSRALAITLVGALIGLIISVYTPFSSFFGLTGLGLSDTSLVLLIVVGYFVATEIGKRIYPYKKMMIKEEKQVVELIRKEIDPDLH